jgi:hypothetical protein
VAKDRTQRPTLPLEEAAAPPRGRSSSAPSSKAERQEMFLPVSGFVWFYPEEIHVINHHTFQRLSRINQLGHAYLVFRAPPTNESSMLLEQCT